MNNRINSLGKQFFKTREKKRENKQFCKTREKKERKKVCFDTDRLAARLFKVEICRL